ncbi:glycoside hydrolase domain-containing protein [Micromonospora sp. M12]
MLRRLYVGSEIGQGYLGDEDNGEMSSWYILSSLGIYPCRPDRPSGRSAPRSSHG